MEDRLPRGLADVHAEVVAVGLVDSLDGGPRVGDGGHQLRALLVGGLEPRRHVTAGDEQGVAWRDGELVPQAEDEASTVEDVIIRWSATMSAPASSSTVYSRMVAITRGPRRHALHP